MAPSKRVRSLRPHGHGPQFGTLSLPQQARRISKLHSMSSSLFILVMGKNTSSRHRRFVAYSLDAPIYRCYIVRSNRSANRDCTCPEQCSELHADPTDWSGSPTDRGFQDLLGLDWSIVEHGLTTMSTGLYRHRYGPQFATLVQNPEIFETLCYTGKVS